MLIGLFRMRIGAGDTIDLARVLWKQVLCRIFACCGTPVFTNVNFCSQGSHLALDRHGRRGPFHGMCGYSFALLPFRFLIIILRRRCSCS